MATPRTYLAGLGAGTSLLAAAALAFLTLSALVAFDAVPFGGGDDPEEVRTLGAPEAAVAAAAAAATDAPALVAVAPASAPAPAAAAPGEAAPVAGQIEQAPAPVPGAPVPAEPSPPGTSPTPAVPLPGDGPPVPDRGAQDPVDELIAGLPQILGDTEQGLDGVLEELGEAVGGLLRGDPGDAADQVTSTLDDTLGAVTE